MPRSFCLAIAIVMTSPAFAQTVEGSLKAMRNVARPLIVSSDFEDDPRVARQIQVLDLAKAGLDERNVKILREVGPHRDLRKSLGLSTTGFAIVLVGKDGTVKSVWHDPVDPRRIFKVIDAMPMRRDEMKR